MKNCLKTFIKYVSICMLRIILHIFYIFPIHKNRIILISYNGQKISCNPKYICESLVAHYPNKFEFIWVLNSDEKHCFKTVKMHSLGYIYYSLTSKFYINNMGISSYLPKRKKQVVINTWHGGGAYKKVDLNISSNYLKRMTSKIAGKETDYFISSCKKFSQVMPLAILVPENSFVNCGMPRNDIFFHSDCIDTIKTIKEKLQIADKTKIVLYAPTFRDDRRNITKELDTELLLTSLQTRFGGEWKLLVRAHQSDKQISSNNYMDVTAYTEMQELLLVVDILITDYSSSMWDFSLTNKPCFIFAPDAPNYIQNRDFYTPMDEWPYPLAYSNEQLKKNILAFEEDNYVRAIKQHHEKLGSYETGKASERIASIIYDICYAK